MHGMHAWRHGGSECWSKMAEEAGPPCMDLPPAWILHSFPFSQPFEHHETHWVGRDACPDGCFDGRLIPANFSRTPTVNCSDVAAQ